MQIGASLSKLVLFDSDWCNFGSNWCSVVQFGIDWRSLVQPGVDLCTFVQVGAVSCNMGDLSRIERTPKNYGVNFFSQLL